MSNSTDTTTLQPEYLLGMLLSIVSILISTSALLIQKYSAKVEAGNKWYKRWRLFAGVSINTGSEVLLSSFAIYFAPVSLLAPLQGFGLIFNAVLTHFGLVCGIRERMPLRGLLSTLLVIAGVVMVAISAPGGDDSTISMDDYDEILGRPGGSRP